MREEYITIKLTEKEYDLLKRLLAEKIINLKINTSELTEKELLEREIELNKYKPLFAILNYVGR